MRVAERRARQHMTLCPLGCWQPVIGGARLQSPSASVNPNCGPLSAAQHCDIVRLQIEVHQ
jgi:hypothetical protein